MCELLPPISEDMVASEEQAINAAKIEQLMMTMIDEKDKLMDDLQKAKEDYDKVNRMLAESQAEKEALIRQLQILLPQVCKLSVGMALCSSINVVVLLCIHIYCTYDLYMCIWESRLCMWTLKICRFSNLMYT